MEQFIKKSKFFFYPLQTKVLILFIKKTKNFLYSLKAKILAYFVKHFVFHRKSSTLYKNKILQLTKTEISIEFLILT